MMNSWGRLGAWEHQVQALTDRARVAGDIKGQPLGLPYGMGRSYGDVCLNPDGMLWTTRALDRFIDFDEQRGVLRCEAGVLLRTIQGIAIPRGWSLPVTPGTQLVSVGGAIANDVHGKNHHRLGSFGDHVLSLTLARTDGSTLECGPAALPDWFQATVGGLGLTGVIIAATIQLRRVPGPWLDSETIAYAGLDAFFDLADASESGWEHTVSWIDCLAGTGARGVFMRANPIDVGMRAPPARRLLSMPLVPPLSLVNPLSLRAFNAAYYRLKARTAGRAVVHCEPFFYPLDRLRDWNRMYGPNGFYQYQSVVPRAGGMDAVTAMLGEIAGSGQGSFLAVLKTFGDRPAPGMLSFPQPGVTLALDFPNRGASTLKLFDRLDAVVGAAGGRLYPAKDARMPRALFEAGYPRLQEFSAYRDPGISSAMSRRLMGS